MSPTLIQRVSVEALDIPLHEPFGIAGGAQKRAANLLVTVELADGTLGFGEAAPLPAFNGETQEASRAAALSLRAAVVGADARAWRAVAVALRAAAGGGAGAARCAIETAILDALTKRADMPLWAFFGGAGTALTTDITITTGSPERAEEAARRASALGFRALKVKVGGRLAASDPARIEAIVAAAPEASLILDGNGGLTAAEALGLVAHARRLGATVALLEQPVPRDDWDGMKEVTRRSGVDVAADESAASAADVLRIAAERAATVVNIKLMKAGIAEALDIAAVARAAGLGLMIGGMVESVLAMTTSACFAAGLGGFSFVDLDTPMFLAENPFDGGFAQRGPVLSLDGIRAGHGAAPKRRDPDAG
ncbi:enolase C-terminal domain-like protein [Sorangium sp. So ce861]|uniref:enolase C-terminal domain-like protein n=1 Tax=Sorangium sp. So ce861 TaxID=3133323 RepID=UPI003F5F3327